MCAEDCNGAVVVLEVEEGQRNGHIDQQGLAGRLTGAGVGILQGLGVYGRLEP
jgi:hypothetical protein